MSNFYTLLTQQGQAAFTNALSLGSNVKLSKMAVGDGGGGAIIPIAECTNLANEVYTANLNRLYVDEVNPNYLIAEMTIPTTEGGFTVREIGLLDKENKLLAYGNFPETYKPQLSEGSSRDLTIRCIIEVANASNVQLIIDPTVTIASRNYVDQKILNHNHDERYLQEHQKPNLIVNGSLIVNQCGHGRTGIKQGDYVCDMWKYFYDSPHSNNNTFSEERINDVTRVIVDNLDDDNPAASMFVAHTFDLTKANFQGKTVTFSLSGRKIGTNVYIPVHLRYNGSIKSSISLYEAKTTQTKTLTFPDKVPTSIDILVAMSSISAVGEGYEIEFVKLECNDKYTGLPRQSHVQDLLDCIGESALHNAGEIVCLPYSDIPGGYIECNGAELNRTTYAPLFNKTGTTFGAGNGSTTFNIPDLRGEFIRGFDNGKGTDSGRVLGSNQTDEFKSHSHTKSGFRQGADISHVSGTNAIPQKGDNGTDDGIFEMNNSGGVETRPRNIALVYAIKY